MRDTPERIGPRAVQAARSLIQTSVGPGTPGAEQGGAVRFTDLAELLGWLCADLAAGRAAGRWYWRRWRGLLDLGAVPAAVQVLGDHAANLMINSCSLCGLCTEVCPENFPILM